MCVWFFFWELTHIDLLNHFVWSKISYNFFQILLVSCLRWARLNSLRYRWNILFALFGLVSSSQASLLYNAYLRFITHRMFLFIFVGAIFIKFENKRIRILRSYVHCFNLVLGLVNLVLFSSPYNINSAAVLWSVEYLDVKRTSRKEISKREIPH